MFPIKLIVHSVESLEDWDLIRDEGYSLKNEHFETLDNRLTRAFKHLILPDDWHLLGLPENRHIKRETIMHFAARLGLVEFALLLLQKNGAEQCLRITNVNDQIPSELAKTSDFDDLAYILSNPPEPVADVTYEANWLYKGSKIRFDEYSNSTISVKKFASSVLPISPEDLVLELSKTSKTPAFRLDDVTGDLREHTENVTDDVMQDVRIHEPSFFYNQSESYMNAETNDHMFPEEKVNEDCDVNKRFSLSCPDLNDQTPTVSKEQDKVLPQKPKIVPIRAPLETNDHLSVNSQRDHKDTSPTRPHSWHSSENLNEDDNRNYQFNYESLATEKKVQDDLNANISSSLEQITLPASPVNSRVSIEDAC